MVVTDKYVLFWRDVFSNFYPCEILLEISCGNIITFTSSEQYFMYKKAKTFNDDVIAETIVRATTPYKAKKLGRRISSYVDEIWVNRRFDIMCDALRLKFNSNNTIRNCLQLTLGKTIVEASPEDKIWGIGLHETDPNALDESKWQGENLLGKALMKVRDEMFNK